MCIEKLLSAHRPVSILPLQRDGTNFSSLRNKYERRIKMRQLVLVYVFLLCLSSFKLLRIRTTGDIVVRCRPVPVYLFNSSLIVFLVLAC